MLLRGIILLALASLLTSRPASAQNWAWAKQKMDSLDRLVQTRPDDTVKVGHLRVLANGLSRTQYDHAGVYAQQGLELSHRLHYPAGVAGALAEMSRMLISHDQPARGIAYADRAVAIYDSLGRRASVAKALAETAHWLTVIGDPSKGYSYGLRALTLAEQLGEPSRIAQAALSLGHVCMDLARWTDAQRYYLRGLAVLDARHEVGGLHQILLASIGSVYAEQGQDSVALTWFERAYQEALRHKSGDLVSLRINMMSALSNLGRHEESIHLAGTALAELKHNDDNSHALGLTNLACTYISRGASADLAKARQLLTESLVLLQRGGSKSRIGGRYMLLGGVAEKQRDLRQAVHYYDEAILLLADEPNELAQALNQRASVQRQLRHWRLAEADLQRLVSEARVHGLRSERQSAYRSLADLYQKWGRHKEALQYQQQATALADSLTNIESVRKQAEAQARYVELSQQRRVDSLRTQQQLTNLQVARKEEEVQRLNLQARRAADELALLAKDRTISRLALRQKQQQLVQQQVAAEQKAQELLVLRQASKIQQLELARQQTRLREQRLENQQRRQQVRLLEQQRALQQAQLNRQHSERRLLLVGIGLAALLAGVLYNRYHLSQRVKLEQLQKEKAVFAQQLLETELKALRAQMNPHFLFNCLNSIQAFILKEDRLAATDYLQKFARLIRLILDNARKATTTLEDEAEILDLYLGLEQLRLKGQLQYEISLPDGVDAAFMEFPSLVVQPLVENSVWHGIQPSGRPGWVRVAFERTGQGLRCVVEDDGIGRAESERRKGQSGGAGAHISTGLELLEERLRAWATTHAAAYELRVVDGERGGTRTEIALAYAPVLAG